MNSREFLKAGHSPTLFAAFLYFDMSFMVWVLLGPLGVQIAADLKLDPAAKGLWSRCRCLPARCCASSTACWSTGSARSGRG